MNGGWSKLTGISAPVVDDLPEAGDRGGHGLDEDELAAQRIRQAELGLDERESGR